MNRAIPPPRLIVQFKLQHALIGLSVAAIALAVLSPWLRSLTTAQWSRLAFSLAPFSAGLVMGYVFYSQLLRGVARKAGEPEFLMRNLTPLENSLTQYCLYSIGPLSIFTMVLIAVQTSSLELSLLLILAFGAGFNMLHAAIRHSSSQGVWLSQRGVNFGPQFISWQDVTLLSADAERIDFLSRGRKYTASGSPAACEYFAAACGTPIAAHAMNGTQAPADSSDCPVNGTQK